MALPHGTRLGGYEIADLLGAGGMGEVYRARDSKLGRDVAIKILPAAFTSDPERLARFGREARVLASLNHANIGAIYGLEDIDGIRAIVLELVEGETLADRIGRGQTAQREGPRPGLAISDALTLARQIADALDAAHEKGIIHRDLKPANIKITPGGAIKVLDFGLAKTIVDEGDADGSGSTFTAGGTREGIILGTAAYMSPEQACGRPIDKRTDIWAFGCVVFEMLTGRSPFAGETFANTAARILEREPDWSLLPAAVPPNIVRLLERCLRKDAQTRLRDIADARLEIDDVLSGARAPVLAARAARPLGLRIAGAGLVLGAVAVLAYVAWERATRAPADAAPRYAFSQLTAEPGAEWFASLSPDGKWVVYSGQTSGNRDIYLRGVGGQNPINLTAEFPEDDDQPAFSPDGEKIAFRSSRQGGGIFIMGRTGEAPRRLTSGPGFRPAWSPDGTTIAYSTESVDVNPQNGYGASGVWLVDVASGKARDLNVNDGAQASFSPDGKRLAVTTRHSDARQMDIEIVPIDGGERTTIVTGPATDWNPVWSPDGRHLYYSSDRGGSMNLWRVAIDPASGQARGEPEAVTTPSMFAAHPSLSSDGKLMAFSSVSNTTNVARLTFDPLSAEVKGEPVDVTTGSRPWSSPDPSPDGQWVTFYSALNPGGDVYVARTDGTSLRQLTSDAAMDRMPRWSPDGNWIAFFSNRSGPYSLWKIHADGSGLQQASEAQGAVYPTWSPDGARIAIATGAASGADMTVPARLLVFDPNRAWNEQKPDALPAFSPTEAFVPNSWSPDGQRLAGQVTLTPKGIVTYAFRSRSYERFTDYGEFPVWLPDNRRILFASGGRDYLVLDTVTRQVRKIYTAVRGVLGPPRLTRDGRTAYFTRRMTESDIWLMRIE